MDAQCFRSLGMLVAFGESTMLGFFAVAPGLSLYPCVSIKRIPPLEVIAANSRKFGENGIDVHCIPWSHGVEFCIFIVMVDGQGECDRGR